MDFQFYQVDAFSTKPFSGNPAGVVPVDQFPADELLQKIASENNLAETAYFIESEKGYNLRWFTPAVEVDLCGHATLASAHILWEKNYLNSDEPAVFHTRSGELIVRKKGQWLEMDFPAFTGKSISLPDILQKALHLNCVTASESKTFFLVEVDSPEILQGLTPDFGPMTAFKPVIVTSRAKEGSGYDFVSRVFCPSVGVNEDPVTGSAHCHLATYWKDRLGKDSFFAYQASSRGGEIEVRVSGDRVFLTGQAVTIIEGTLHC